MKRNVDLYRKILEAVEARTDFQYVEVEVPGHDRAEVNYHVSLLARAGMLLGHDMTSVADEYQRFSPSALTWAGHEYLECLRGASGDIGAIAIAASIQRAADTLENVHREIGWIKSFGLKVEDRTRR